jgi:mono/diheme cytochrome c family protein
MGGFDKAVAQDALQGATNAGKQLYLSTGCFDCHGRAGQGGAYNREAPSPAKTIVPTSASSSSCAIGRATCRPMPKRW